MRSLGEMYMNVCRARFQSCCQPWPSPDGQDLRSFHLPDRNVCEATLSIITSVTLGGTIMDVVAKLRMLRVITVSAPTCRCARYMCCGSPYCIECKWQLIPLGCSNLQTCVQMRLRARRLRHAT